MQLWSDEIEAMRPEARDVGHEWDGSDAGDDRQPRCDRSHARQVRARQAAARDVRAELRDRARSRRARDRGRALPGVHARATAGTRRVPALPRRRHDPRRAGDERHRQRASCARRTGMAVVSVDYRMAPEHPYPAGPDDGVAVAAWLLEHGEDEFGSARILTGGESAGGYMAAAVLLRIRDELGAIDRVDGANLVYGVHDWGRPPSQRGTRASVTRRHPRPGRHRVLRRVLPAGHDRRRAPRARDLARVRRSVEPPARVDERRHRRPPARRHAHARGAVGGGRERSRAVRRARHAPRLRGVPVRHHRRVERADARVVRRHPRPARAASARLHGEPLSSSRGAAPGSRCRAAR